MIYKFREIWKTVVIDGVEHPRYQVSNLGRVKCLDWGKIGKEKMCKLSNNGYGYFILNIDGKIVMVSRIVAEAFIQNPQHKPEVDHVDTNRQNNCVWNLRWATKKENRNNPLSLKHYRESSAHNKPWLGKTMLGQRGADNPNSIAIVQLSLDGKFIKKWAAAMEVKRELGIDQSSIAKCCRGKLKSAGGFRWMYYYDWFKTRRKKSLKDIKPLFV